MIPELSRLLIKTLKKQQRRLKHQTEHNSPTDQVSLAHVWTNYGLSALGGPLSFLIRPVELDDMILIVSKS